MVSVLVRRARSECAGYPLLFNAQRVMTRAIEPIPDASGVPFDAEE